MFKTVIDKDGRVIYSQGQLDYTDKDYTIIETKEPMMLQEIEGEYYCLPISNIEH